MRRRIRSTRVSRLHRPQVFGHQTRVETVRSVDLLSWLPRQLVLFAGKCGSSSRFLARGRGGHVVCCPRRRSRLSHGCNGSSAFRRSFCWPRGIFVCCRLAASNNASTDLNPSFMRRSTVFSVIFCATDQLRNASFSAESTVMFVRRASSKVRVIMHRCCCL